MISLRSALDDRKVNQYGVQPEMGSIWKKRTHEGHTLCLFPSPVPVPQVSEGGSPFNSVNPPPFRILRASALALT